jgi:predicted polyphosphate/ATP-dependent NAD kinase
MGIKDTANAAVKIIKRGANIIAVALDNGGDCGCYDALSEIYPYLAACTELKRLTGQLLRIISRNLS